MPKFVKSMQFECRDQAEADQVQKAIETLLTSIQDKKHLIELSKIIEKKPGLIQKAIPYLNTLKYL